MANCSDLSSHVSRALDKQPAKECRIHVWTDLTAYCYVCTTCPSKHNTKRKVTSGIIQLAQPPRIEQFMSTVQAHFSGRPQQTTGFLCPYPALEPNSVHNLVLLATALQPSTLKGRPLRSD